MMAETKRTDLDPGQKPYNAEQHGDRQEMEGFQQGTPGGGGSGGTSGGSSPSSGGAAGGPPTAGMQLPDVFAPNENPRPSPTTMQGRVQVPDNPDTRLLQLYSVYPHPDLLRLIQKRTGLH